MVQYLKAGLLRGQVGPAPHGSQLDGGHGAADVQVLSRGARGLHQGDAVTAAHRLGWVLGGVSERVRCSFLHHLHLFLYIGLGLD